MFVVGIIFNYLLKYILITLYMAFEIMFSDVWSFLTIAHIYSGGKKNPDLLLFYQTKNKRE